MESVAVGPVGLKPSLKLPSTPTVSSKSSSTAIAIGPNNWRRVLWIAVPVVAVSAGILGLYIYKQRKGSLRQFDKLGRPAKREVSGNISKGTETGPAAARSLSGTLDQQDVAGAQSIDSIVDVSRKSKSEKSETVVDENVRENNYGVWPSKKSHAYVVL